MWRFVLFSYLFITFCESVQYRLPESLSPAFYDLKIKTHLDESSTPFKYYGKVRILLNCLADTDTITLHAKNFKVLKEKTEVSNVGTQEKILITDQALDTKNDFYTIQLQQPLRKLKDYYLVMKFEDDLLVNLVGYYRSSYKDEKKKTKWLAITKFEPAFARRAFPCFDEPSFKARFKITLGHHKMYQGLSNMPINKTVPMYDQADWVWDEFLPTVRMSTYLVAYSVHSFQGLSSKSSGTDFNVFARNINQVKFSAEVGPKALQFYEDYFDINYPLPKVDMFAVPDFISGAMENWGLITFRESRLMYDDAVSSPKGKFDIASTVSHELAHQWFGNLVTMKWWTDLWLNEGFATYMSMVTLHTLFPEWNSINEQNLRNLLEVYKLDSLKSSHQISIQIEDTNEIPQIFDAISYKKGSYIIRMMALFLGQNVFRKGVTAYLKAHAYQNAEQDDLWNSLTQQAHEDDALSKNLTVKTIMDTWTLQIGYPVISISRDCDNKVAKVSQSRFLSDGSVDNSSSCWWVPVSWTDAKTRDFNRTEPKIWLSCPGHTQIFPVEDCDCSLWLIANIQGSGLYKVNYDEKNWELLTNALLYEDFKMIHEVNRALIIENSLSLATTGIIDYSIPFKLLPYLKKEDAYLPWKAAVEKFEYFELSLRQLPAFGKFKKFMRHLIRPIFAKLGGLSQEKDPNGSLIMTNFKSLIALQACKYMVSTCIKDSLHLFRHFMKPNATKVIPTHFQYTVYCTAVKHGGEPAWEFLWKKYISSDLATEKDTILKALACAKEIWLLNRYLDWSINGTSGIRSQDSSGVFLSVSSNELGFYVARNFLEARIADIYKNLAPNGQRMNNYISSLASQIIEISDQNLFFMFLDDNKEYFQKATLGVAQAREVIKANILWQKKYRRVVEELITQI